LTIFDTEKWLSLFGKKYDKSCCFELHSKEYNPIKIMLGFYEKQGQLYVQSPVSASFGGFSFDDKKVKLMHMLDAVSKSIDYVKTFSEGEDINFSIIQRPRYVTRSYLYDYEEFALTQNGFQIDHELLEYYIDLKNMKTFSQTLRNEIRQKLPQNFRISSASTMKEFIDFRDKICIQQNKTKGVPDEDLLLIAEHFPDNIQLYAYYDQDIPVCMILAYALNEKVSYGINWFQDEIYKEYGLTAKLISYWLDDSRRKGFEIASFGAAMDSASEKPNKGLVFFKERFRPNADLRRTFTLKIKGEK